MLQVAKLAIYGRPLPVHYGEKIGFKPSALTRSASYFLAAFEKYQADNFKVSNNVHLNFFHLKRNNFIFNNNLTSVSCQFDMRLNEKYKIWLLNINSDN